MREAVIFKSLKYTVPLLRSLRPSSLVTYRYTSYVPTGSIFLFKKGMCATCVLYAPANADIFVFARLARISSANNEGTAGGRRKRRVPLL